MVTVSTAQNNLVNSTVPSALSSQNKNSAQNPNQLSVIPKKEVNHSLSYYKNDIHEDELVKKNTLGKRIKINIEKTLDIPLVHFPRGLGGAPDYTFFEFLQTAKFPYYIGGPILAALFYAGVKKDNFRSAGAAQKVAKHMALGVGLYYVGAALAKSIINNTVRLTRGVDLKQPYAHFVPSQSRKSGLFKKNVEFHTAFESADFTRTDLLYNKKGKTPEQINENYIEYGKKYGIKDDANNIDSTIKPLIKKTIVMARAWQYALTAFFVTLGVGMANQPAWDATSAEGFKKTISQGIFGKNVDFKERLHSAKVAAYDYILKPFGKSFMEFWKGHSKGSSIAGKSVILATAAATLTAISLLMTKTSAKDHKFETTGNNKIKEVQK